ncbi:hypothetical protein [Thioclava atlantica]|uniref:Uncharacterized protein n=1 Tax=Thioclava atlantica TaxID=1317124 RepID=A0A085TWG0_9RHOB|nr:hypothetical protein [Thioclava atlantica]KFE35057.1 hypothetical protein DW2_08786 [Thioclava atlantica]
MRNIRKIIMIGATFFLAAATGHVMQSVGPTPPPKGELAGLLRVRAEVEAPKPLATPVRVQLINKTYLTNPPAPNIASDRGVGAIPVAEEGSADRFLLAAMTTKPMPSASPSATCAPADLSASSVGAGRVLLSVSAPCQSDTTLSVHAGSLKIRAKTDAAGQWSSVLPAFSRDLEISIRAQGREIAHEAVTVSGVDKVNRTILETAAAGGLNLNVYENGTAPAAASPVNITAPRTPDTPLGGYMLSYLTDDDQRLEIYTAPASLGDLQLEVQASVRPDTCGTEQKGRIWNVTGGIAQSATPVTLALPDCPADGGLMMLPLRGISREMTAAQ